MESNKTLRKIFKTPEAWWNEAKKYLLFASPKDPNVLNAFFWECRLFDYLADSVLAGRSKSTVNKILAESAFDFVSIKKKDDIWRKVLPQIEKLFRTEPIRTHESEKYFGKEGKTAYGKKKEDTKTAPILSLASDKVSGVNWGEVSKTLLEGFYQDGKFNPNVENQNESGWRTHTTDTKEQKQQQIGRLIQAVLMCDVDLSPYLEKYVEKYTWRWTSPAGDVNIDFSTGSLRFTGSDYDEEDDIAVDGKPKENKRPDLDDISFEQWQAKFEAGEAVELDWDLECWARYKRRLLLNVKGKSAASQEVDNRKIKALERLMEIFSRDIYIPPLEHFDEVMNGITGFKFFKKELRDRMETSYRYKMIGEKQPQVFYCLLGKPGVGKTEICKTLAKALNRPICILSMGGASETKPLEGVDPAWKASSWSDILETMVERKSEQVITLAECEEELKIYNARKVKTEFQVKKIKELEEWIKRMKDDKVDFLKMDLGCKAPIILLDEAEKVKHPSVLDAMGKILDDNVNWAHMDKFLEYRINLGYCLIFVTMNWYERAPDFIRDRCKFVDIELLTYQQRIEILENRSDAMVRQFFPVIGADGKVDRERQKEHLKNKTFSPLQQQVRDKIDDRVLKACITTTWGIRGGIMNLKKILDLLLLIDVREQLNEINTLGDWDWDSDEKLDNSSVLTSGSGDAVGEWRWPDDHSDKVRRLRYSVIPSVSMPDGEELILTKKVDEDKIEKEKNRRWSEILTPQNQIKDWPDYDPNTDAYFDPNADDTSGDTTDKIAGLRAEIARIKKHCEDEKERLKKSNEADKVKLQELTEQLRDTEDNRDDLQKAIRELEEHLKNMGVPFEDKDDMTEGMEYRYLPTIKVFEVSDDGIFRFGVSPLERKIKVVQFDDSIADKVKKLSFSECGELVQVDLTGLINLEKLTFKRSRWDNVKIKGCVKLKKVSIKDCVDVDLNWLSNSDIEEVKIQ